MCKYINKNVEKKLKLAIINYKPFVFIGEFESNITHDTENYNLAYYITKIKIDYINYLIKNGLTDENVPPEDMKKYYKPKELVLVIDGKISSGVFMGKSFNNTSSYSIKKSDYDINFGYVIEYLDCLEDYKRASTGELMSFDYKGKRYYFEDIKDNKIIGNKVPYSWTMSMIRDFFDAKVEYDYENSRIIIETSK